MGDVGRFPADRRARDGSRQYAGDNPTKRAAGRRARCRCQRLRPRPPTRSVCPRDDLDSGQWPIAFFSSLRREKKSRVKTTIAKSTSRQAEYSSEEKAEQQEERPCDIAIRLSRKAPGTPEELAADAILLVEVSSLEQYQIDLQLPRAALIRMLTEAQKANVIEGDATAEESPSVKKRGRPPGSKNKPKEAASPEPGPATDAPAAPTMTAVGNGVDPEDSAKERGAYYDDDLSNPYHPLHRPAPDQAVQP